MVSTETQCVVKPSDVIIAVHVRFPRELRCRMRLSGQLLWTVTRLGVVQSAEARADKK